MPITIESKEYLTLREVAVHLEVSDETIKRWRYGKGGRKPANFPEPDLEIGGRKFWTAETLDYWNNEVRSGLSRRWKELTNGDD